MSTIVSEVAMFKAIVYHELRRNARWMVLGFLLMLGWMVVLLPSSPSFVWLVGTEFGAFTAVAGLFLGVIGSLRESRGDALGFLLHRPVDRSLLFFGKVTGGLVLYTIAVALPPIIVAAWWAWPGNVGQPFDLLLLRGPLAYFICGAIFFFAGFLYSVRTAGSYISRLLVFAVPGVALVLASETLPFSTVLVVCAAGLALIGTAAWGTFVAAGGFERQPLIGRFATSISLGAGVSVVGAFTLLTLGWVGHLLGYRGTTYPSAFTARLEITTAGPAAVVRQGSRVVSITHLSSAAADDSAYKSMRGPVHSDRLPLVQPFPTVSRNFRTADDVFIELHLTGYGDRRVSWYYLRKLGAIVGYEQETRRKVAWAAPTGFASPDGIPQVRFEGELLSSESLRKARSTVYESVLAFPTAVYLVNAEARRVDQAFAARPGETVIQMMSSQGRFLIATSEALHVLNPVAGTTISIPHPRPGLAYITLHTFLTEDATEMHVSYERGEPGSTTQQFPVEFTRLAGDGTPLQHYTISELPPPEQATLAGIPIVTYTAPALARPESVPHDRMVEVLTVSAPALWHLLAPPTPFRGGQNLARHHAPWFVPIVVLVALLSGAGAMTMSVRSAFPPTRTIVWGLTALVLGPVGIALMLTVVEWPARETCPACGRKRVVVRDRCEHCEGTFAPPTADGTEILEPAYTGV